MVGSWGCEVLELWGLGVWAGAGWGRGQGIMVERIYVVTIPVPAMGLAKVISPPLCNFYLKSRYPCQYDNH